MKKFVVDMALKRAMWKVRVLELRDVMEKVMANAVRGGIVSTVDYLLLRKYN